MSARFIDMLLQRSPRERMLLAVLVLIFLPVVIFFGVLLPLHEAREAATQQRKDAIALHYWVTERVVEKSRYAQEPEQVAVAPIGTSAIEQSLIDAGLRTAISDLSAAVDGTIELRFDLVRFTALADWMSASSRSWGYEMSKFRFEATDTAGKVSAALTLTPLTP